ncbi:MAG: dTMP kinase [Caldisericia bacterium]
MKKGFFVAIEGLDGAGSSTQSRILSEKIAGSVLTKEPCDGTLIGDFIRGILRHKHKTDNTTLQLLFAADRKHHYETVIKPAMDANKVVISDRYVFSSMAYGLNNPVEWIEAINSTVPKPDITFFLDVLPSICMQRINGSRASTELFEKESYLKQVRKRYVQIAQNPDNRIIVIDGTQSQERVASTIWNILVKEFKINV